MEQQKRLRTRIQYYQRNEALGWQIAYFVVFVASIIGSLIHDNRTIFHFIGLVLPLSYGIAIFPTAIRDKYATLKKAFPTLSEDQAFHFSILSIYSIHRFVIFIIGNAAIYLPIYLNIIVVGLLMVSARYVENKAKERNNKVLLQAEEFDRQNS